MDGYWKVYFELNQVDTDTAVEFCKRISIKAEKAIFYLHPVKDKTGQQLPHIHGLVYNWPNHPDTYRSQIKKTFNVSGTEFGVSNTYEKGTKMSEATINTYVSYMSKGKFDPIYNKEFADDWIGERKREWKTPTTVRISGDLTIIANDVKKKTITQFAIARELETWILEQIANDTHPSHANIIRQARTILHSHNRLADDNMLVKICQDAMWPTHETSRIQKIISRL